MHNSLAAFGRAIGLLTVATLVLSGCAVGSDSAEIRVWLVGSTTSEAARASLAEAFADENPGSTLVIEQQSAEGLLDALTSALGSSDGPDVVQFGTAEAATLVSSGLLRDLSAQADRWGVADLVPGLVTAGSLDGALYAPPLYAHARAVFADPAVVTAAPATLDEYIAGAKALAAAHPDVSGVYFAGQDWRDALPFVWSHGGQIAEQVGGVWDAQLSSDAAVAGWVQVQDLMMNASRAPKDAANVDPAVPYCAGQAIQIAAGADALMPASSCATDAPRAAPLVYALPAPGGGIAPVLAHGAHVAVSEASAHPELAESAVALMLSDSFQALYAGSQLTPATRSVDANVDDSPAGEAFAAAAAGAMAAPVTPKWAEVEQSAMLEEFMMQIAVGGDVAALAAELDARIEAVLNG